MNTLVHPTPPPAAAGARPPPAIDLPSGPPPPQAAPASVPAEPAPRKTGRRTWLLVGMAVTGVLGTIGAGLFAVWLRAGHPVPARADWLSLPQAVSPQHPPNQPSQPAAAQPAPRNAQATTSPRNPFEPAGPPQASTAAVPAPSPVPLPTPRSSADDLRALKQSGPYAQPAPPRPAAVAAAPAAATVQDAPAPPPAAGQPEIKIAPNAAPGVDPAHVAGASNPDPAAAPAPQSLIDMVAGLADDIAQERKSDAELRKQIATLLRDTDQRLSEFDRRLTVAKTSVAPAATRVGFERVPARLAPAGALSAMRTLAATPPGARPYEIRAASPGVAVLGTLDGTPAVVEIAVGDQVPGYGRVNAIAQKGNAWAVQCEHGTIQ